MKVALTAEGTYPHQFGGVSVWCDQLIRGMPEYRFQLVALVGSGAEPVRWSLPSNVASLTTIPLWGPPPPVPWRARLRRGRPLPPVRELIDVLFAPPGQAQARFTDLMREIFAYAQCQDLSAALASDDAVRMLSEAWRERFPPERPASLNDRVYPMPGVREMPNGHGAMHAREVPSGHGVVNAQNGRDPIGNGRREQVGHLAGGAVPAAPTLHDAVIAMQLIEHALRPLSHPPVEADLVHVVTNGLGVLPALAAKWRHGTPMLVSEHGVYIREQYMHLRRPPFAWPVKELFLRFVRLICALGYQEADLIAPGNVYNKRWEEQLGADPSRLRTVYNGVDPVDFPMLHEEPEVPTISWVGRIDPVKDLETLLLAFSQVLKEMPEARLRMFGSPARGREKYLEGCQALAADLGISEQATFEGRVRRIRDAYQAGHVVVLCSITEGFPYALIEAMTCGRSCVGTDVGGVREALADTGIVVPPRNPAVLAQACLRLLRDASLRRDLGAAARQRALELFTVDRTISTFDEIYKLLASGQGVAVTDAGKGPGGPASDAEAWDEAGRLTWKNGSRNLNGQDDTDIMPLPGNGSPAGHGQDEATVQPAQAEVEPGRAGVQLRHGEVQLKHGEVQPAQAEVEPGRAEVQPGQAEALGLQPQEPVG
jgi:glycosyltransferase involved in cell wall biosynthesis